MEDGALMTDIFSWPVRVGATGKKTFRTKKSQFGDGYSSVVTDGLNNSVSSWPVSFVGYKSTTQAIKSFLDGKSGAESFFWTPPLGV